MSEPPPAPATILVVDDDPVVRTVACRLLRRIGYEVLDAASGMEALEIARQRDGALDLLLTDVVMPELGGWELSKRLRAEYPEVPVLFMSGYTEEASLLERLHLSEVHFLAKPFEIHTLARSVGDALRPR